MRIRRYTGKDAQEAMLKVKMDLGSEAIILSTRKVRKKGFAGLFGKPLTEVLAAIDEDYGKDSAKKTKPASGIYNRQGAIRELQEEDSRVESLESRIKQMESMLERIYHSMGKSSGEKKKENARDFIPENPKEKAGVQNNTIDNRSGESAESSYTVVRNPMEKTKKDTDTLRDFARILDENEIEPAIIDKIIGKVRQLVKDPDSMEEICMIAQKILQSALGQPQAISFRDDGKPTVVLFAGPTGVGKTTTLAKIAADYTLNHRKRVGLITADTYRIAAVEQLKTYAEILNIPVSVIYTPQEVKAAIAAHHDKDLILIDTAGRSHKNTEQFSELKMLVACAEADEVFLVLSCSMGRSACREVLNHYRFLKKYKLLFTKLDEALVPGMILNARYVTGKPLSFTTAGQSVPDDIEIADVAEIVKCMLRPKGSDG